MYKELSPNYESSDLVFCPQSSLGTCWTHTGGRNRRNRERSLGDLPRSRGRNELLIFTPLAAVVLLWNLFLPSPKWPFLKMEKYIFLRTKTFAKLMTATCIELKFAASSPKFANCFALRFPAIRANSGKVGLIYFYSQSAVKILSLKIRLPNLLLFRNCQFVQNVPLPKHKASLNPEFSEIRMELRMD